MRFSLIVPCYNDRHALEHLLKSYNPPDDGFEMIVVDDCSTDGTAGMVKPYPVRYIKMNKNSGPAAARNRGVQEANGSVIVFCDSDIEFGEGALQTIKKYFNEEGTNSLLASGFLPPRNMGKFPYFKYLLEKSWFANNDVEYTEHFSTRLGALKKELFFKAGGFDETITSASVEDYEFGHRLATFTKTKICPDVYFSHQHPYFLKQAKLFFHRSADYINVLMAHRRLDNFGASTKEASLAMTAFLSQLSLPLAVIHIKYLIISAVFFLIHLYQSRNLIKISLSKKGGFFPLYCIAVNYILCFFILSGACWGMTRYLFKKVIDR